MKRLLVVILIFLHLIPLWLDVDFWPVTSYPMFAKTWRDQQIAGYSIEVILRDGSNKRIMESKFVGIYRVLRELHSKDDRKLIENFLLEVLAYSKVPFNDVREIRAVKARIDPNDKHKSSDTIIHHIELQ